MTDTEIESDTEADAASRRSARREAQNALGREHVLDAAEEVFSRKGFHEATIKEIAAVAEFSVGAVYGFFENKDDLFVQVMERRGATLVPAMRALLDDEGSPAQQLHRLAELQIDFFRQHPAFARLFVRATGAPLLNLKASVSDATRERYDEAMALQADLFARGQARGELVAGPPNVLSEVFSSMVLAFQSHDPETIERPTGDSWSTEDLHAMLDRAFLGVSDHLYLHEVIDIVGLGAWPYMEHTARAVGDEKVNFVLQGTYYTMGITGRWSQVINLWDIPGGWDGWRTAVDSLNLKRTANTDLEGWWKEAFKHRTGGFDRLLIGADGSPRTEELVERGVVGSLFVHEITTVRPGTQRAYLAAVLDQRVPLMADYGHTPTGLYEVAMNDTEVVTVWATDVDHHVALQRAIAERHDVRLATWRASAQQFAVSWREELMTPYPGCPLSAGIA